MSTSYAHIAVTKPQEVEFGTLILDIQVGSMEEIGGMGQAKLLQ